MTYSLPGRSLPRSATRRASNALLVAVGAVALFAFAGAARAQTAPEDQAPPPPQFYVKLDAAGVIFHSSGKIYVADQRLPGGSINISNNATATLNLGYFVTSWLSIDLLVGVPPHAAVTGTGTAAPLGTAVMVNYGPAVLSALYHYNGFGAFRPFIGPGLNYTLIMNTHSVNVDNTKIASGFGAAGTIGFDYDISPRWGLNAAVTQILMSTKAKGSLGGAPVVVKVTANPTVITGGVTYRF